MFRLTPELLVLAKGQKGQSAKRLQFVVPPSGRITDVKLSFWDTLKHNCRRAQKRAVSGTTAKVVQDALFLYGQAMQEPFTYTCLLKLWQVAEQLTCTKDQGGHTKNVAARLRKMGRKMTGEETILEGIAKKRNDIVHQGYTEFVDDTDVNNLRTFVDRGLVFLSRVEPELPNEKDLISFYHLRDENNSNLTATKCAISFIEKHLTR